MSDVIERNYPPGIPERRRRPSPPGDANGLAALGALTGLAMSKNLGGAIIGALIGAALTPGLSALSLKDAVEQALRDKGAVLVNFYRHGPYHAEVLFSYAGQYWTIASSAPSHPQWTQAALDDWLYGDLVDVQLPKKIPQLRHGSIG